MKNEVARAARRQLRVGSLLLLLVAGTALSIDALARNDRVIDALEDRKLARIARIKGYSSDNRFFVDFEERITLEEIPQIDASRGGVYFIGSSNMKWAYIPRKLSEPERRVIHNFGIGATNHTFQDQFVRFLVEKKGILSAGGDKSLFVIGTSYHTVAHVYEENGFFPNLWKRHGFYTYSQNDGISERPAFLRPLQVEKVRVAGFLHAVRDELEQERLRLFGQKPEPEVRKHDAAKYNERWQRYMGPDWQAKLDTQTAALATTIEYLKERGAAVSVLLLPQGSWEDNLPYEAAYTAKTKELCAAHSVPVLDHRDLFGDDDFADTTHFATSGQETFLKAARDIALPHLRRTGALP